MKTLLIFTILAVTLPGRFCPPVDKSPKAHEEGNVEDFDTGLEYDRYLREVVQILEEDEGFKKKLEDANISYIKSGEIANHLELVSHRIRTRLDELKRREVQRLRELMQTKVNQLKDMPRDQRLKFDPRMFGGHLDHKNPHTFEVQDLAKLITKATLDLEEADKQRREQFKEYEMEKEHLQREKLKRLNEDERKTEEEKMKELKGKHQKHPKLHEPGHKDQLEEVWEKTDHMDPDDFDPKSFFKLHDVNGDGFWDEMETEALFQRELDKVYDPENPEEDDMMERQEDMNRMREHMDKEVDKNKDRFISLEEFMEYTKTKDFDTDDGWMGVDEEENFTDEELDEFEKKYDEELKKKKVPTATLR